jgi:hypothetical protein
MNLPTPQQRPEVLAQYRRWRAVGEQLNGKLVESLGKRDIDEAGRRLGLLRNGVLCFDTEDTITVLMDFAIRHVRRNGRSAVERCLAQTPPADPEQLAWLKAVSAVHYRILQVEEVYRGFGIRVCDVFRDESELMIDVNFSHSVEPHVVFASHIYSFDGYWVTTGASLPVMADVLEELISQFERRFGRRPEDYRTLSPERQTELATLAIRTCLSAGMSQRVRYDLPTDNPGPHFDRLPDPSPLILAPPRQRTGRNDPCPCGSGRKFKHCCLR